MRTWVVLAAFAVVACGVAPARYAGWEPMPRALPTVPREEAWQRLTQSRALWRLWREGAVDARQSGIPRHYDGHAYSYIRARQISEARVEFTLFVVDSAPASAPERVTLRALVSADPNQLPSQPGASKPRIHSEWLERGSAVGSHPGAAVARTVDELYDDCARLLSEHPKLEPHLYFHPTGVLMQCGFTQQECSNCQEISIESFSHYSLDWERPRAEPAKWVCATGWGLFAPDTSLPELESSLQCAAGSQAMQRRAPTPLEVEQGATQDICQIDPAACPQLADAEGSAFWNRLPTPCEGNPLHQPSALEVGKAAPLSTWTFPFSNGADGIECGDSLGQVEHRVTPTLELRPRPAPSEPSAPSAPSAPSEPSEPSEPQP